MSKIRRLNSYPETVPSDFRDKSMVGNKILRLEIHKCHFSSRGLVLGYFQTIKYYLFFSLHQSLVPSRPAGSWLSNTLMSILGYLYLSLAVFSTLSNISISGIEILSMVVFVQMDHLELIV